VEHETAERPTTADPAVDEALRSLDRLATSPVREHVAIFESVHGALADRLNENLE
jgi:hypothetical protein